MMAPEINLTAEINFTDKYSSNFYVLVKLPRINYNAWLIHGIAVVVLHGTSGSGGRWWTP